MGTSDAAGNLIGGDFGGWRTLTVSLVLIHAVVRGSMWEMDAPFGLGKGETHSYINRPEKECRFGLINKLINSNNYRDVQMFLDVLVLMEIVFENESKQKN